MLVLLGLEVSRGFVWLWFVDFAGRFSAQTVAQQILNRYFVVS
jgi:hypothetical protein